MVTYSVFAASDYIRLACFRMCWWQRSDTIIEKHLTGQKVIVPYVEDTNSDILFTIKGIEMNFSRDVYGVRLYLPTRFEPGIARNTEVIADRTIWDKWTNGNYSLFPVMWTSNRRHVYRVCGIRLHPNGVFSNVLCVDAQPVTWESKNIWLVKKCLFGTWKIPTAIS